MLDLIIKNGTLVTPYSTFQADIAVTDGKISAVGSAALFGKAARVIDAPGKYILPGLIDVHNHFEAPFMGCRGSLDFFGASVAGAFGGVTTFMDFTNTSAGQSVLESVKIRREEMAKSAIDYGIHAKFVEACPRALDEIKALVDYGCPSFKLFMTYKQQGVMSSDEDLLKVFAESAKWGALPGVHAESNAIAETNVERFREAGAMGWADFARSKPPVCELEAVERVILLARYAGTPLYIFHLSSGLGLEAVRRARALGQQVFTETCPHYLTMTTEKYCGKDGHLYIMSPPLREESDQDALWGGLADGSIAAIGSDNCTYSRAEKEMFLERDSSGRLIPDFTKVVNGVTGVEERLAILLEDGVRKGRISLNKLVEITSCNPARIFGLFPRKGTIQAGSDADLVLVDPDVTWELSERNLHYGLDYSVYTGKQVTGKPVMTIARGQVIVEAGEFTGSRGSGEFLTRKR